MSEAWLERALAPPRAFGAPLGHGRLRVEPEDFLVEEELGFTPAGAGSHVLLKVRKRDANTEWVARELASASGCRPGEVGYAGLKDRRAVAVQWFSVPQPRGRTSSLAGVCGAGFEVLEAHAHSRKLPRGALAANAFTIRIRDADVDDGEFAARVAAIAASGVPNFFGPQRFGHAGANLARLGGADPAHHLRDPRALRRSERGFVLSAARSLIFNAVLAERVTDATWGRLETGDVANLDARGSVFPVEGVDDTLRERCERLDVHPTGPLWGRGELVSRDRVRALEERIAAQFEGPCELVMAAGMDQERRSLRLAVRELSGNRDGADLVLRFRLTRGSFATSVLRELLDTEATQRSSS
jgi:tRNA pseudouridine13 synthase